MMHFNIAAFSHGISLSLLIFLCICLCLLFLLSLRQPTQIPHFIAYLLSLCRASPSLCFLLLLHSFGPASLLLAPEFVYSSTSIFLRRASRWLRGVAIAFAAFFFLICKCNPLLALHILLTTGQFFFSLLPIPQCVLSLFYVFLRIASKLYQVYSTVPLGSLLCVAERGLDGVLFVGERLGPSVVISMQIRPLILPISQQHLMCFSVFHDSRDHL